jgi:hypothetical protein
MHFDEEELMEHHGDQPTLWHQLLSHLCSNLELQIFALVGSCSVMR